MRQRRYAIAALFAGVLATMIVAAIARSEPAPSSVDTALVVAVDVSNSVDDARYRLQMEGIALALEDTAVVDTILSGPNARILLSVVTWADAPEVAIPWQTISGHDDARRVAGMIRSLPKRGGEYTCLARMLDVVGESVVANLPAAAERIVVDVSGDGIDNCAEKESSAAARDRLVARGAVINGLPIIVKGENDIVGVSAYRAPGYGLRELPRGPGSEATTLDAWFTNFVIGGPGAFVMPANGYEDFGRAFRQKFITEISFAWRGRLRFAEPAGRAY